MNPHGASGAYQRGQRWPLPPLAAPRGPRELGWHLAAVLTVAAVLASPTLRVMTPMAVVVVVSLGVLRGRSIYPRELANVALTMQLLAAAHLTGLAGPSGWHTQLVELVLGRFEPPQPPLDGTEMLYVLALILALTSIALAAIVVLVAFDRRTANRDVADDRVWQRQQQRRRDLMLDQHRTHPAPEVW